VPFRSSCQAATCSADCEVDVLTTRVLDHAPIKNREEVLRIKGTKCSFQALSQEIAFKSYLQLPEANEGSGSAR